MIDKRHPPFPGCLIYLEQSWLLFRALPNSFHNENNTKFDTVSVNDTPAFVLATIKEVPTKDPWSSKRLTDLKLRTWCCVLSMQGLGWILLDPERWSEISNTTEQTISSREM